MGLKTFISSLTVASSVDPGPDPEPGEAEFDIVGYIYSPSNKFVDVYFSEGVYAAAEGVLIAADLRITSLVPGGVTAISIASIKKPNNYVSGSATNLAAGDSIVRVFLTLTGTPDGTETFQVRPVLNSVFNVAGVAMAMNKTTGNISLNNNPFNLWDGEITSSITTTGLGVSTLADIMANVNLTQSTDADRPLSYRQRAIQFDSANTEWLVGGTNANYQKQQANNFAIAIKDLKPNDNQNTNLGYIIAYFNPSNNHGWTLRHGFSNNQLNILMFDNTTSNAASFQNYEDRTCSFIIQNESGVLSIYDENNNRVGSQGSTSIGTIVWTSISLFVGRRQTQTTNYFNGEWGKLMFFNQALSSAQRVKLLTNMKFNPAGKTGTLTKYMYPVVNTSIVSSDKDTMQIFLGGVLNRDGVRHIFYTGNAADGDIDRIFKATKTGKDPYVPFTKHLTTGSPTVIVGPSGVNGTWNENEVFGRTVIWNQEDGEALMFVTGNQIGATPAYTIGLYTSTDSNLVTFSSAGQVYTDGVKDIITIAAELSEGVIHAIVTTSASGGATNNFSYDYITSTDYGRTFTKVGNIDSLFKNIILVTCIKKVDEFYYVFCTTNNRDSEPSSGTQVIFFKTQDFVTSVFLGVFYSKNEPRERSCAVGEMILDDGEWEVYNSYLKNQNKTSSNGGEGYSAISMNILDNDILQQPNVVVSYPSWVKKYWPLDPSSGTGNAYREMIDGDTSTFAGAQWSLGLQFFKFAGTGFTFANNGLIFNAANFALKLRVEIILTGTINLFSVGTDIVVQLVSGNLRVALNNATKDYITTADIAKPSGITDPGTHVYVGFIWVSGTLRLCVGNTIGISVTQTVNNSMTNISNSGSSVLLCSGATIEARSFVAMSGQTDQQYLDTDL